jgi:hypothetical protein
MSFWELWAIAGTHRVSNAPDDGTVKSRTAGVKS